MAVATIKFFEESDWKALLEALRETNHDMEKLAQLQGYQSAEEQCGGFDQCGDKAAGGGLALAGGSTGALYLGSSTVTTYATTTALVSSTVPAHLPCWLGSFTVPFGIGATTTTSTVATGTVATGTVTTCSVGLGVAVGAGVIIGLSIFGYGLYYAYHRRLSASERKARSQELRQLIEAALAAIVEANKSFADHCQALTAYDNEVRMQVR